MVDRPIHWTELRLGVAFQKDGNGVVRPRIVSAKKSGDLGDETLMSWEELAESLASMGYDTAEQCLKDLNVRFKHDVKLMELANELDRIAGQFDSANSTLKLLAHELYKILSDMKSN
jgi:hypothetical protein